MASASPTARTLAEARKRGWGACVVEKWIPQKKRRLDAFGFGDILAVDPAGSGAILIQATSTPNMSSRVEKITTEPRAKDHPDGPGGLADKARVWLAAGNRILVWGWAKRGKAGERKLWTLREVEITMDDLFDAEAAA
jgi:hypothetical protein